MYNKTLISIITVNLNNAKGLQKTIQSVIHQTNKAFEYIVIDGGSTDESLEIIKQYANSINFWVSEKDEGIYNAMNKGWQKATGKYCLFLNSGDFLVANDILDKVAKKIQQVSADIYFGDLEIQKTNGLTVDKFHHQPSLYFLSYSYFPHPTSFIAKSVLAELGGYNETYKIIADRVFFTHALIKGKKFEPLCFTVTHFEGNGISSKGLEMHKSEKQRLLKSEFPFLAIENQNFAKLRYYELSRIHQFVNKILNLFSKGI